MKIGATGWCTAAAALLTFGATACGNTSGTGPSAGGTGESAGGTGENARGAGENAGTAGESVGGAAAIDDDGDDVAVQGPSDDCTFEMTTSGGQVVSYAPALMSCTTLGPGLYVVFVNEERWQAEVTALDLMEGQTGVELAASFHIGKLDFGGWDIDAGGCTVEVTEQTLLGPAPHPEFSGEGRQYRIAGHGSCTAPAVDLTGSKSDIVVGLFSFRARKSFRD